MQYTDEYIISELQRVDENISGTLTVDDVRDDCDFSMGAIKSHFGGLNNAKDVAGIEKSRVGGYKRYTDEEVIEWMKEKDSNVEGAVTSSHIKNDAPFSMNVVYTKFDRLNKLKEEIGIEKNTTSRPDITGDEYYRKVKDLAYCENCGESFPECIEFHHLDKYEKEFSVGRNDIKSAIKKYNEMKKCVMVCANCHRKSHSEDHDFDANNLDVSDIPHPKDI